MIGMGCKAGYLASSPGSWTELTNLLDLGLPQEKADRVEKTVHSTTSRRRRYEPGLISVEDGFLLVAQDLSDATQKALRTFKAANTKVWFRMEVPTNDACTEFVGWEFEARVGDFEPGVPKDGLQTTRYALVFDGDGIFEDAAAGASKI